MKQLRLICFTAFLALLCSCHQITDPFASDGRGSNTIGFYYNGVKYVQYSEARYMSSPAKYVYAWREDNDILILSYVWKAAYPWDGAIEALGFRIPGQRQYYEGDVILLFGSQLMVVCKRTQDDNDSSLYEDEDEYNYLFSHLSPSSKRQYLFPVDARITVKRRENSVLFCDFEITGVMEGQEGGETVQLTKGVFDVTINGFKNHDIPLACEDYHKLHERYCDYIGQYYDKP